MYTSHTRPTVVKTGLDCAFAFQTVQCFKIAFPHPSPLSSSRPFPLPVFQDQLEGLEAEKEELGQQIDALLVDSRGLLQLKMSLSLEVATYRYSTLAAAIEYH